MIKATTIREFYDQYPELRDLPMAVATPVKKLPVNQKNPKEIQMTKKIEKSIATVAVILTKDGILESCTTFKDNKEGNELAEKLFKKLAKKMSKNVNKDVIKTALEDGYLQWYPKSVFITHT